MAGQDVFLLHGQALQGLRPDADLRVLVGAEAGARRESGGPRMTFSFSPTRLSTLPARAASVSTLVVSWKLAAEMKLELCTAALVMPSSWVLAVAGLGLSPLAGVAAEGLDLGVDLLRASSLGHDRPVCEVAIALFGDLHALGQRPG